jgi:hypothetical protein
MYVSFVENFDAMEFFVNLRKGFIGDERVQMFDLPDSMVPEAMELTRWDGIFDRAVYNSTRPLILNASKAFFKAQAGQTRAFIRDLNNKTGKYFGKKFTDTAMGAQFRKYERNIVQVTLMRVLGVVGITAPPAMASGIADKVWNWAFGEEGAPASSGPQAPASGATPDIDDVLGGAAKGSNAQGSTVPSSDVPTIPGTPAIPGVPATSQEEENPFRNAAP